MITTCAKLPLKGFILCSISNGQDLLALAETDEERSDEFEQARKEAWLPINSEYVDLIGDKDVQTYVGEMSQMQRLAYRIMSYTHIANTLSVWHYEPLAEALRTEFDVTLDPSDKEAYQEDLDRVIILLKSDEIELKQLQFIQDSKSKDETGQVKEKEPIPESNWDELLIEIYTHVIKIPAEDLEGIKERMMTNSFALYVKRLKQYYKSLTRKGATLPV